MSENAKKIPQNVKNIVEKNNKPKTFKNKTRLTATKKRSKSKEKKEICSRSKKSY